MEDKNNYKLAFYITLCGLLIALLELDDPITRKMKLLNIAMLLVSVAFSIKEIYIKLKKINFVYKGVIFEGYSEPALLNYRLIAFCPSWKPC